MRLLKDISSIKNWLQGRRDDMREIKVGDFVTTEFEGEKISGFIIAAKRNSEDGEWFVKIALADMRSFVCPVKNLIDCVFVGEDE